MFGVEVRELNGAVSKDLASKENPPAIMTVLKIPEQANVKP
jgi:hypothetical protein